jgi:hypothetical protein
MWGWILLLGGGFEVLDQDGGGNMATASFPNSNYSWMARSRDEDIPTPSRLRVFAIGISPNLMKPNPAGPPTSIGNVDTTFASSESLAAWACVATRRPSPGYALCGGGACAHFGMVRGETFANLLKTLMLMSAKHDLEVVQAIKEIVIANGFLS